MHRCANPHNRSFSAKLMSRRLVLMTIIFLAALPSSSILAGGSVRPALGYVYLQVESHGEAWFTNTSGRRTYLGDSRQAFAVFSSHATGISNPVLESIPVGILGASQSDADSDGLPDALESAVGTDQSKPDTDNDGFGDRDEIEAGFAPLRAGGGKTVNEAHAKKFSGRIFIAVERNGELWYVYPKDGRRYYISGPDDAWIAVNALGIGISDRSLAQIPQENSYGEVGPIEEKIFELVNSERKKAGRSGLILDRDLSAVAREHSDDLASENIELTNPGKRCDYPLIHHEGFEFGLFQNERLYERGIKYFSRSGENIVLLPMAKEKTYRLSAVDKEHNSSLPDCGKRQNALSADLHARLNALPRPESSSPDYTRSAAARLDLIKSDIENRKRLLGGEPDVISISSKERSAEEAASDSVASWIESEGHRKNMLEPAFDTTGIGAALINGYLIITQLFITKAHCGYEGAACCIEANKSYCYQPNACASGYCRQ